MHAKRELAGGSAVGLATNRRSAPENPPNQIALLLSDKIVIAYQGVV
jgi:hypothetical protein